MTEHKVTLTGDERKFLEDLLEITLKERQVEEHRTRTPTYREHILQQEELAQGILKKLKQAQS
jgi:hypothetical protein